MIGRFLLAAALLLAGLPASAQSPSTPAKIKVVATFSILGDLVDEVGGEHVDLSSLVGPDTDAHAYQPRPTDARTLAAAQALVSNGLGFEGWTDRLAKAAPFKGRTIVASKGVPTIAAGPAHGSTAHGSTAHGATAHGSTQGHSHAHGPDPHCWQDVACTRRYVANIAQGLAEADPTNAAAYRERATAYDRRLAALDQWVKDEIGKVPAAQRKAITGHDSFRYFSKAYGVQFLAPRGYNTESEPSAKDVAALIRQAREQKIKALFVENMTNPGMVEQIARESGAVVGPRLYSDALSKPGGPAATYEAMMRHNVTALVQGMLKN